MIRACSGDREKGIEFFISQNDGAGWTIPETLCLADYGLGRDERAKEAQPVASRLGPRFYDWQLAQNVEESWRECHLHARNLQGKDGYVALLSEAINNTTMDKWAAVLAPAYELAEKTDLLPIFVPAFAAASVENWPDALNALRLILRDREFTLEPQDLMALFFNVLRLAPDESRPALLSGARDFMDEDSHLELVARLEAERLITRSVVATQPTDRYDVGEPQRTLFD
jgi:hypothetical protein